MRKTDELLTGDRTLPDLKGPLLPEPTPTSQELAEAVGHLRARSRMLSEDVAEVHDTTLDLELAVRTDEASKRSVPDLLAELAGLGFAWRDIARLVGVSVPGLRKWRQGTLATGANRRAVARLLAFVGVLTSDHLVEDVASWLEVPLGRSSITGMDLYSRGGAVDLLLYAADHLGSTELLDRYDPDGSVRMDARFELDSGSDGEPIIRLRSPG